MSESNREEALFQAAAQLSRPDRAAFLSGACRGDAALRQRLDALLAAHEAKDSLLEPSEPNLGRGPFNTVKVAPDPADEAVGKTIGRYKVLEKVGEGGCGVVYVAEQTEPVRRRVALKVIKLGMDTKAVVARFEAERQALAMMDHPNIAKVLDAGTTETGRPFFVMELVRGIRITDYCDQANLSTRERLDLFIKVCQAIQHAHQKGIIHRDIKPSNILVTLHDGVPVPKVIDFGIAKATEGRLTDATVYTQLHQFIGTPAYMSPEQAEMSGLDIDTRSDIYSLGVLLYELLTGSTPFDSNELVASGIDQMRKTIREKEPVRPSTRLATLGGDELTTTARRRSTETSRLLHQTRGDLDWIVMKCLEKDRTRRYETANGLAADLKRHLNNETVVARPPSNAYRFQKLVRRNKLAFASGVAIAMVLLLGIIASTWQAVRATQSKREALVAEQQAEASEKEAVAAQANESRLRQRADVARSQAEGLVTFMIQDLQPSLKNYGRLSLLKQVDQKTVDYFGALPPDLRNPKTALAQADAVEALSEILTAENDMKSARELEERAKVLYENLAAQHPEIPEAAAGALSLAWLLYSTGPSHPLAEVDARQQDNLRRWRELLAKFPENLKVKTGLGGALWNRALFAADRFNKPDEAVAAGLELQEYIRKGMAKRRGDRDVASAYASCLNVLAIAYQADGQKDKAMEASEESEAFYDKAVKSDPGNLALLSDAADAARYLSYRATSAKASRDAELIARERYRLLTTLDPANAQWKFGYAMSHMMECYYFDSTGQTELARQAMRKFDSLLQAASIRPEDAKKLVENALELASLAKSAGDIADAKAELAIAESRFQSYYDKLPAAPFDRLQARVRWLQKKAALFPMSNDWTEVEGLARERLALISDGLEQRPGDSELLLRRATAQLDLGSALLQEGHAPEAVSPLEQALAGFHDTPPSSTFTDNRDDYADQATFVLADSLARSGSIERAESLIESLIVTAEADVRKHPESARQKSNLAQCLVLLAGMQDAAKPDEAARRQSLLDRAAALLNGPGVPIDKELLGKIAALRGATAMKQP